MNDRQNAVNAPNSLIRDLESVAAELFAKWDKGMKAGKLLTALEGRIHTYDPRVTRIRNALAAPHA